LLNVAWMCTTPALTTRFSFFLKLFFFDAFTGCFAILPQNATPTPREGRHLYVFDADFFLLATVPRRGPLRVRALVWVRCPRTGSPRRCRRPR
jgi:hypothetical protein